MRKKKKLYLMDVSNNTGKDLIAEDGTNVSLKENAKSFDTFRGASKWADEKFPDWQSWGLIVKE